MVAEPKPRSAFVPLLFSYGGQEGSLKLDVHQVSCIDENKKVVGEGSAGCTNFNSVGKERAEQNLRTAILDALKVANVPEGQGDGPVLPLSCLHSMI